MDEFPNLDVAPLRRHAARPHRLRGQHRASWTDELAPLLNNNQRRYAAVVSTAVIGASAVVLGSAAALPDSQPGPTQGDLDISYLVNAAEPGADVEGVRFPATAVTGSDHEPSTNRAETEQRPQADQDGAEVEPSDISPIAIQPSQVQWTSMVDEVRLTSLFGPRWGRSHNGIDLDGVRGTPIYAVSPGVVTKAGWAGGFGKLIVIDHGDGHETYYAHASALHVAEGDEVEAGQHIMDMGNTGYSFGDHLHFEIHMDGQPVDPLPHLRQLGLDLEST
ncbi:M23 family metallopeptidase [Natronoglycomyces albus]|uniref:M23 family metallopeptidase n=1 Tax=Natronoglycomyces albus TaxID=2811108 RepID=A0A895XQB6_9ACTN|nr:M23 family metallopeptidase [Natronoglycomyces albus]QSB04746.1 M23 family metallopeptidase [Natronoglycomyces albus]